MGEKLKLTDIIVENRTREDFGDVEELAVSIQRYGLLHPIVIDNKRNLIAGERRYRAHKMLGLEEIEVKFVGELDELTRKEMEIEENIRRKNFTWHEELKAETELDKIKRQQYGSAVPGHGGGWSQEDTARSLNRSNSSVSQDLKLARGLEEYPELSKEKNKHSAWKKYLRLEEGKQIKKLASVIRSDEVSSCFVHGSADIELRKLETESVDLILTDPPFAIALDKIMGDEWGDDGVYEDDKHTVMDTLEKVIKECYRVLKNDRHMYCFFGMPHYALIYSMLKAAGFNVNPTPIIWNKTSGGAITSRSSFSSAYIAGFHCLKGTRELNKLNHPNVFTIDRVPPQKKHHPAQMPTSLTRRIIELSTFEGELVIDPYAGSGAVLVGALETRRKAWGCEMKKEHYDATSIYINDVINGLKIGE